MTPAPKTLPARSETDPADRWDLSSLYTDEAAWEKDFEAQQAALPELSAFQGRLGEGAATVRAFFDLDVASDLRIGRLHNYAARRSDEDTTNGHYLGLKDRITSLYTRTSEAVSFFRSELVALDDATLQAYLDSEELAPFRFNLERILHERAYILSEREERLLALAGEATRVHEIFGQLNNADLRFGFVEDENGDQVEVSHGSYKSFLTKRDRAVRRTFFETYYASYEAHKHTLAATLASGVRANVFYAKARGFSSARAAALHPHSIPESVYDNLVAATHDNIGGLYKYYELRRQLLGLDAIHFYDVMVPVVPDIDVHHTYDAAVDRLVASLAPLGAEYTDVMGNGLRNGWVDRYENRGKRSGAYSAGCYDSEPFILMNFKEDSLDDVYTLTHEAGHSMHSWSSNRAQPPQYADYSIFVAEVASTFNEALLTHHLLETTDDPMMRAYIINRQLDAIRGTLFRQVMFADYEHRIHRRVEEQKPLSLDDLQGTYHDVLERFYGPQFTLDPQLDLECLRIPHFYYNFYVYQYATGISAALCLAERVLQGGAAELEAYHGFLRAGSSAYPIDVLKKAGVDMTGPEPVAAALQLFDRRVDELSGLLAATS